LLIIYNEVNDKVVDNQGLNSLYPKGNFPELPELPMEQIYLRCDDDSTLANTIMNAYDYTLEYDTEGNITNVNVLKTYEQYRTENPSPATDEERIAELELAIADLMGGA
jgi:hypothetical protein